MVRLKSELDFASEISFARLQTGEGNKHRLNGTNLLLEGRTMFGFGPYIAVASRSILTEIGEADAKLDQLYELMRFELAVCETRFGKHAPEFVVRMCVIA